MSKMKIIGLWIMCVVNCPPKFTRKETHDEYRAGTVAGAQAASAGFPSQYPDPAMYQMPMHAAFYNDHNVEAQVMPQQSLPMIALPPHHTVVVNHVPQQYIAQPSAQAASAGFPSQYSDPAMYQIPIHTEFYNAIPQQSLPMIALPPHHTVVVNHVLPSYIPQSLAQASGGFTSRRQNNSRKPLIRRKYSADRSGFFTDETSDESAEFPSLLENTAKNPFNSQIWERLEDYMIRAAESGYQLQDENIRINLIREYYEWMYIFNKMINGNAYNDWFLYIVAQRYEEFDQACDAYNSQSSKQQLWEKCTQTWEYFTDYFSNWERSGMSTTYAKFQEKWQEFHQRLEGLEEYIIRIGGLGFPLSDKNIRLPIINEYYEWIYLLREKEERARSKREAEERERQEREQEEKARQEREKEERERPKREAEKREAEYRARQERARQEIEAEKRERAAKEERASMLEYLSEKRRERERRQERRENAERREEERANAARIRNDRIKRMVMEDKAREEEIKARGRNNNNFLSQLWGEPTRCGIPPKFTKRDTGNQEWEKVYEERTTSFDPDAADPSPSKDAVRTRIETTRGEWVWRKKKK